MTTVTVLLVVLATMLWLYAWRRGDGSHWRGVMLGGRTLLRMLPLLLAAFAIVGFVDVLAPQRLVQAWIGPGSGWQGLLLGQIAGILLPGGPYVVFPVIAALYRAGAGLGPVVALTTSWAMGGLLVLSFELPFMGWRFTAVRWGLGLVFPVLAGVTAQLLFGG